MKRSATVIQDQTTDAICRMFDFPFDGTTEFVLPVFQKPENFNIGVIVGPSGSGKSSILRSLGREDEIEWDDALSIASHFKDAEEAKNRLMAAGLNSIPSWLKPYYALSTGERFRADLARRLRDGAIVDEFSSVVDRNVAKSCSVAMSRFVRSTGIKNLVLASCHRDILEWLNPDWVFDTAEGRMFTGRYLRPPIRITIQPCDISEWQMFRHHHYLSADINRSCRCWVATWDGVKVGFTSALAFPNGNFVNAWREHRTVVLPDFQGMGIGVRLGDAIGELFLATGCRYFSKTSHPRMGEYRNKSPYWRATSKNGRSRHDYVPQHVTKEDKHKMRHRGRQCFSHEYIGTKAES